MSALTDQDWIDLGKRAVASPHWRWMPGMLVLDRSTAACKGYRIHLCNWTVWVANHLNAEGARYAEIPADWVPSLRDPCTVGGLVALVREAWGECPENQHAVSVEPFHIVSMGAKGWIITPQEFVGVISAPTEAEALVAALEAAPSKEKSDD